MESVVTGSARATYKRCPKKWYWKYKLGLVPKAQIFGATDLGTWVHEALALWYQANAKDRMRLSLVELFSGIAGSALEWAKRDGAPDEQLEKGEELSLLGENMMQAYAYRYGNDASIHILAVEMPLQFEFPLGIHRLKPDAVYRDGNGDNWLLEHKTTQSISTEYLSLDDQARPYGSMAELALKKVGILKRTDTLRGIMYNFMRKGFMDEREYDSEGYALNKNGTRSKRQPAPLLLRHPVFMSRKAKVITLKRVEREVMELTSLTNRLRAGQMDPMWIPKTPNKACKRCEFFKMCVMEEEGGDITDMRKGMYVKRDPLSYYGDSDTIEESGDFDMG